MCRSRNTSDPQWILSYKLSSRSHLGCAKLMTTHVPPVPQSDTVSHDVGARQRTGEGSESVLAVLRDRRDVDQMIAQVAELDDVDSTDNPG